MRIEAVDMSELTRRIDEGIYDHAEFDRAMAWTQAICTEGKDLNPPDDQRTRAQKDGDWETVVRLRE